MTPQWTLNTVQEFKSRSLYLWGYKTAFINLLKKKCTQWSRLPPMRSLGMINARNLTFKYLKRILPWLKPWSSKSQRNNLTIVPNTLTFSRTQIGGTSCTFQVIYSSSIKAIPRNYVVFNFSYLKYGISWLCYFDNFAILIVTQICTSDFLVTLLFWAYVK